MSIADLYERAIAAKGTVPGWCTDEKACALVDSILEIQAVNWIPTIVEIGVFGGQSLLCLAVTAAAGGNKGFVWGIDPWSMVEDTTAYADDPENVLWWSKVDYEGLHKGCLQAILTHDLTRVCSILRMSSRQASRLFEDGTIDILHIDGNHAPVPSTYDVMTWIPKVRPGGYVWFDDVDWKQTETAYNLAKMQCNLLKEVGVGEPGRSKCALLQRSYNARVR